MCKRSIYLMLCVLVFGVTGSASAELIAYWPFDEGSGTTLNDVVGGNNGPLQGDPMWIAGPLDGALDFDGNEDLVTIPNSSVLQLRSTGQYTVAVWVNVVNPDGGLILFSGQGCVAWANWYLGVTEGEPDARNLGGPPKQEGSLVFGVRTANGGAVAAFVAAPFVPETWMHVAATYDGVTLRIYIDGQELDSVEDAPLPYDQTNMPLNIAGDNGCSTIGRNWFTGKIDDLRIYDVALWENEIQDIMTPTRAWKPNPADLASGVDANTTLSWNPGKQAVTHNVYLGTTMEDVSAATADNHPNVEVSLGLGRSENTYIPPEPLVLGQTYYWRVDEVNDAEVWPGEVWSFLVQPLTAYNPSPVDGAKYLDPDIVLSWNPGCGAESHIVYFGTNRTVVEVGDPDASKGSQTGTTLALGLLELGQTYYWRIDEFDGTNTHKGDIWSFSILPDIPISNPNLVGWWKLDEGVGTRAVDWSGYNRHGTIYGGPIWVEGYDGGALEFDGINNYVDLPIDSIIPSLTSCTITTWVDFSNTGGPWQRIFGFFNPNGFTAYMTLTPRSGDTGPMTFAIVTDFASPYPGNETDILEAPSTLVSGWHHVAVVIDGSSMQMQLCLDGTVVATGLTETLPADLNDVTSNTLGHTVHGLEAYFTGLLDDFRIYDVALTQEEVKIVMRVDTLRAWNPIPSNGAVTDVETALPLSWSPGDEAVQHNVYFGTDYAAVDAADASDTTNIYRGQQDANSYIPIEGIEPNQVYYWRIDEINADATISKGKIWSFTVTDYLTVDDFEDYNDFSPDRIFDTWSDGWNVATNGSIVGYGSAPFAERAIVNSGFQSMPFFYNNTGSATYSEAVRSFDAPLNDWTREGAQTLTLFFRGYPAAFVEDPAGTYAMAAGGEDIWDLADEFRYAYKTLSGDGSITARVVSIENTNEWAKAGVMIRDTLDDYSVHAFMCVTPSNRRAFQNRQIIAETSYQASSNIDAITLPLWVRVVRQGNNFTGYYSENGINWIQQPDDENTGDDASPNPVTIVMSQNIYIGLAYTTHNVNAMGTAVFDNVTTTGTVPGDDWQVEAIGADMPVNEAQPLYVVVRGGGVEKTVEHPDNPNAVQEYTWQQWDIPLSVLSDAGVTLSTVQDITIGVGSQNGGQGGTGRLYFDDIRLYLAEE